jgi:hypothetical protein
VRFGCSSCVGLLVALVIFVVIAAIAFHYFGSTTSSTYP